MLIKKIGFTLAEVLLTLSIIGIVAAVTIPALLNTVNDAQNLENFKKIYSEISQAVKLISIESGHYIDTSSSNSILNEFSKKLIFINRGTWGGITNLPDGFYYKCYKEPNSTNQCGNGGAANTGWRFKPSWSTGSNTAVLPSGAFIIIRNTNTTCTDTNWRIKLSASDPYPKYNLCSEIEIDVNGDQGPNMIGKDFFLIVLIKENGEYYIYPTGCCLGTTACRPGYPNNYNYSHSCAVIALRGGNMP